MSAAVPGGDWYLVEFEPIPGGYGPGEAPGILRGRVGREIEFFDIETSPVFNGEGLPPGAGGQIGLEIRPDTSAVLSVELTAEEADQAQRDSRVQRVELDPELTALVPSERPGRSLVTIGAPDAWVRTRGARVSVALTDSGMDSHPDLRSKRALSFVRGARPQDRFGHGTRCAGILNAQWNGLGIVGVAPEADLFSLKVLDDTGHGRGGWLAAATFWSYLNGVSVVSASVGYKEQSLILEWLFQRFSSRLLIVAAAGNRGHGDGKVLAPARFPGVVAVSALDVENAAASFSSRGPEIDIAAPGTRITTTDLQSALCSFAGTSAACPHVAGVAALVFARYPGASPQWVRQRLLSTTLNRPPGGRDDLVGAGLVNAEGATS